MAISLRLCLWVAGAALVAGSAFAQAANPETTPGDATTAPGQNLSKKLDQSNGVIHPKEVDPAIEKRPKRETRTWWRRQGLQAALPRRSQNDRRLLPIQGPRGPETPVLSLLWVSSRFARNIPSGCGDIQMAK